MWTSRRSSRASGEDLEWLGRGKTRSRADVGGEEARSDEGKLFDSLAVLSTTTTTDTMATSHPVASLVSLASTAIAKKAVRPFPPFPPHSTPTCRSPPPPCILLPCHPHHVPSHDPRTNPHYRQTAPDLSGPSFADSSAAENNELFVKTYDTLVGERGKVHLMPRRGIAVICCVR